LRRKSADPEVVTNVGRRSAITSFETGNLETISSVVANQSSRLATTAAAIAATIEREVAELDRFRPNEPESLDRHERYVGFLLKLGHDIREISTVVQQVEQATGPAEKQEKLESASEIVARARMSVGEWLEENTSLVVNYGFQVTMLGVGCLFLTLCGAPAYPAFVTSALMLGGKKAMDGIAALRKRSD